MKTIQATQVGMNWLSDLYNAVGYFPVKVIAVDGHEDIVTRHKTRMDFRLNGNRISERKLWKHLVDKCTFERRAA